MGFCRLLCEVHEEYATNIALALHGYWVYDFALPLLILHAFTFKTMDNLRHWLQICPRRQITVLDTHDGMGIDDIAGLAEVWQEFTRLAIFSVSCKCVSLRTISLYAANLSSTHTSKNLSSVLLDCHSRVL